MAKEIDKSHGSSDSSAAPQNAAVDEDLAKQLAEQVLAEAGLAGKPGTADLPEVTPLSGDLVNSIDMLHDVELDVKIELGRTEMTVDDILRLTNGSVVELDKLAGDPVDVLVNDRLVARGEVLVVNENFCVRINEIIPGASEKVAEEV